MNLTDSEYLRQTAMTTYAVLKSVLEESTIQIIDVLPKLDIIKPRETYVNDYSKENYSNDESWYTHNKKRRKGYFVEKNPRYSRRGLSHKYDFKKKQEFRYYR